jgi:hypothetical protein
MFIDTAARMSRPAESRDNFLLAGPSRGCGPVQCDSGDPLERELGPGDGRGGARRRISPVFGRANAAILWHQSSTIDPRLSSFERRNIGCKQPVRDREAPGAEFDSDLSSGEHLRRSPAPSVACPGSCGPADVQPSGHPSVCDMCQPTRGCGRLLSRGYSRRRGSGRPSQLAEWASSDVRGAANPVL